MDAIRTFRIRTMGIAAAAAAAAGVGIGLATANAASPKPVTAGVVDIETTLGYQGGGPSAGTGIVLTPSGEVLTNNHVIRGATSLRVIVPGTGRTYKASVVGYDIQDDIAVLQLRNASGLQTVKLGDSSKLKIGQAVTAVGNANGARTLSVSNGTITALGRTITATEDGLNAQQLSGLIQTNAALEPGDSGGPLLDRAHRVVGVDAAASAGYFFRSTRSEGYAIPLNKALTIAKQITSGRGSANVHAGATAFLGVSVSSGDPLSGQTEGSTVVTTVVPGSPADKAGLTPGSTIVSVNGTQLSSAAQLSSLILGLKPGASVTIVWYDEAGGQQSATAALTSGPPQ